MYKYRYVKDGGSTDCYPIDDETTLWLDSDKSIKEVMELAKIKWPDVEFEDISISAVRHHQYHIYYDLYDSSDYVNYLVLSVEN